MALKDSLRLESIYFNNLKSRMKLLKSWVDGESSEETLDILNNCIEADAAILLLYRNLGETWNELTAYIQKEMHDLEDLKVQMEAYHDELNEKIDEVNNYLMVLIRELQERVTILEGKVAALEREVEALGRKINICFDLVIEEVEQTKKKRGTKAGADPVYHLEYDNDNVSYLDIQTFLEAGSDRVLWVKVNDYDYLPMGNTSANEFTFTRSTYDSANSAIVKRTVIIDNTDAVTYTEETGALGGGGGTSDLFVCVYNTGTQDPSITFNVTPAEVYAGLNSGDQVPFSGYMTSGSGGGGITKLLPYWAQMFQSGSVYSFQFAFLFYDGYGTWNTYTFSGVANETAIIPPVTVTISS